LNQRDADRTMVARFGLKDSVLLGVPESSEVSKDSLEIGRITSDRIELPGKRMETTRGADLRLRRKMSDMYVI
jgi:hypothetical protein